MQILLMYEMHVKACSFFVGLFSMCEVMGINMYIAQEDLGRNYE